MFRMQLAYIIRNINMSIQVVQESARVVICSPARLVPTDAPEDGCELHPKHVERIKV